MPETIKESETNMSMKENALYRCYRKTAHPTKAGGVQGWQETEVCDTLNIFDISENRTPMLINEKRSSRTEDEMIVINDQGGAQINVTKDHTATLRAQEHGHPPLVMSEPKTYDARGNGSGSVSCTITGGHQSTISDYTAIAVQGGGRLYEWRECHRKAAYTG